SCPPPTDILYLLVPSSHLSFPPSYLAHLPSPPTCCPLPQLRGPSTSDPFSPCSEMQNMVLQNVATMSTMPRYVCALLEEFLHQAHQPHPDKTLKLEALTNLANETNICRVGDICHNDLVQLLSHCDELVVTESVTQHNMRSSNTGQSSENIQVPMAQASILEYCEHVPRIASDVLRKTAKSFTAEEDIFTLQVINLTRVYIRNQAHLTQQFMVPSEQCGALSCHAKTLFMSPKPVPVLELFFKDQDHLQMGSLSHLLNAKATGYRELTDWTEEAPDPSLHNLESTGSNHQFESESYSKSSSNSSSRESRSEFKNEDQDEDEGKGKSSESDQSEEEDDNSDSINSSSKSERQQSLRKSRWNLPPRGKPKNKQKTSGKSAPAAKEISLLNLEDFTPPNIQPVSPPRVVSSRPDTDSAPAVPSLLIPVLGVGRQELLHLLAGEGLSVGYIFSSQPFSRDSHVVAVRIYFFNSSDTPVKGLHVARLPAVNKTQEFYFSIQPLGN
ncbi:hypothetical protein E2I00_012774, partial [Balaenoptera physalus]